jgi:hypothetical protein
MSLLSSNNLSFRKNTSGLRGFKLNFAPPNPLAYIALTARACNAVKEDHC